MKQIFEQKSLFCLPWAQTILGTHCKGRVNFMALDWLTRVNFKPALLGICVNKSNASHEAILETGEFSVNLPSVEMVAVTDYTGLVSGRRVDKSDLFNVFYGELKAAPMIADCPLSIGRFDCEKPRGAGLDNVGASHYVLKFNIGRSRR